MGTEPDMMIESIVQPEAGDDESQRDTQGS